MTTAEVLNKAADLIERDGWWDGTGDRPDVAPRCALMAISDPDCGFAEWTAALQLFRRHIGEIGIGNWNDRQPNGEVVIKALRDCARSL